MQALQLYYYYYYYYSGPPPVGLPLRQKAKGGGAALEGRAGVEWGVLAALAA